MTKTLDQRMAGSSFGDEVSPSPSEMGALTSRKTQATATWSGVRQARCAVCGKYCGPGSGIVLSFGGGGRIHKSCRKR